MIIHLDLMTSPLARPLCLNYSLALKLAVERRFQEEELLEMLLAIATTTTTTPLKNLWSLKKKKRWWTKKKKPKIFGLRTRLFVEEVAAGKVTEFHQERQVSTSGKPRAALNKPWPPTLMSRKVTLARSKSPIPQVR